MFEKLGAYFSNNFRKEDEDIYDEKIEVFFYEFLRKEQKFESFNHLKEQLQKDKKKCEEKDI